MSGASSKPEGSVAGAESQAAVYQFDEFRLDVARGTLLDLDDAVREVRPKAFALLRYLVENPGRLHGRVELLETLWPDVAVTDDSLTQCMSDLRHAFGDRATHILKTVPRRGYVLTADVRAESPIPAPPPVHIAASGRTALLILEPFDHAGGGLAAQLARLLTTDLLTELTRFEGVRVFAASHGETEGAFRIRGEVRAVGRTLRITARIENAATGAALWAERFERPRGRSSELPDGLVETLSAALVRQVDREDIRRARQKPDAELTVRDLCLLGQEHHQHGTEADTFVALDMFDRAVAAAPDYALAHAWQAFTVQRAVTYGWGPPGGAQVARDRALALARRAVELDPESPLCLSRLAFALLLHQRWDEAVMTARAALRAGRPADYASRNTCTEVLSHGGHPAEAVEAIRRALSQDPHCPPITRSLLGRALLLDGRPEEALPELRWCAAHLPDYVPCFHSLIVAAVETGRMEEARAALREAIRLQPNWVPRNNTGSWFFRHASDAQRFLAAFHAAGLAEPEGEQANDNLAEPLPPGSPAAGPRAGRATSTARPVGAR
jgi:DNA-binding winged helix-turn-helix (wHTH) protein/tetratricopeptide (TPR) repeat protein